MLNCRKGMPFLRIFVHMKIVCVGKNCKPGNNGIDGPLLERACPSIYMKPDSCILRNRKPFFLPDQLGRVDLSSQLVVRINRLGKSISRRFASRYWDAVTLGVDFVATDLKNRLESQGQPAEISYGFDGAAVIGDWIEKNEIDNIQNLDLKFDIDGCACQYCNTGNMQFTVDSIIEYVSGFCTLKTGDIIFAGALNPLVQAVIGQHLQGFIGTRNVIDFHVR